MSIRHAVLAAAALLCACVTPPDLVSNPELRKLSGNKEMPVDFIREHLADEGIELLWNQEVSAYAQLKAKIDGNRLRVQSVRYSYPNQAFAEWLRPQIDGLYYPGLSVGSRIDTTTEVHVLFYQLPEANFMFMVPRDEGTARLVKQRTRMFSVTVFDGKSQQFVYRRVVRKHAAIPVDVHAERNPYSWKNAKRD